MHRIKSISVIISLLLLSACIKPYDPVIDASAKNKYVVSGRVTNTEGWQDVEVSLSSPIESPKYIPVPACKVRILDDKGNIFSLEEYQPGQYHVWMGQEYLTPGTSYKVKVTTPDGEELESGFDKMPKGPKLDSVYYSIVDIPTPNPSVTQSMAQFYVDLDAVGDYSQFYKWEVIETWEYHSPHPAQYYYDGDFHEIIPPDYSKMICWMNLLVKNVFTVSTKNLSQNSYQKYPLHNIDGTTSRLTILYSMLIRQLALSEAAYNYWEQLRINSNEQGGLYEKQPLAIKGNLINLTNSEIDVLGYFYASSESTKRYFYNEIEGITVNSGNSCYEDRLGRFGWKEFFTWEYPIFFYYVINSVRILTPGCIDCRQLGGTTVKPDFWPL
ncbi:MAG: DUF4249 domain-containing protein [Bacteroidota bacterium]